MEVTLTSTNSNAIEKIIAFANEQGVKVLINNLCLKSIEEILGIKEAFLVDSYQRGYKWDKQQVEDLLNDIYDFDASKHNFYCLQPIVVKYKESKGNFVWELIDGQQRMTTIYIILSFLGKEKKYEIDYQTRKGSSFFLQNIDEAKDYDIEKFNDYIKEQSKKNEPIKDNIDNYHFFRAFKVAQEWFEGKNKDVFYEKLTEYTKVIWYQVEDGIDSREVFARLNSGKIALTNAELIKALFLQSSKANEISQVEIAQEWDRIEQSLQNDDFWFFLNNEKNQTPTRIEFIFDLITEKEKYKNADAYFSFRKFSEKQNLEDAWKQVRSVYATLQEWFEDRELYHYVGFLLNFNKKAIDFLNDSKNNTKTGFRNHLKELIKTYVNLQVDELSYDKPSGVKEVLLLFNIQTILSNKNNQSKFNFSRYKNESWDIEHIHAIASEVPPKNYQASWLEDSLKFLDNTQKEEIEKITDFEAKYSKIILEYFSYGDVNDISNLTLLDSGTNRAYKNAIFPVKRQKIINKDKEGAFILPCTKNLFLKYYTKSESLLTSSWNEADRTAYVEAIKETLKDFLPNQNKK